MTSATELADERETVLRAQRGDRAAFSQLVNAYDRRLLYFVRRIVGEYETAFDVLQTVWLTVHRKLRGLKSAHAFRVWLYRITHDAAVTELRKQTRRALVIEELALEADQADEGDAGSEFDNAELVHVGLQRLSVDHRRILTLRFLEDMNVQEIAEVLRCNEGTVKSRLYHARCALRRALEEVHDV